MATFTANVIKRLLVVLLPFVLLFIIMTITGTKITFTFYNLLIIYFAVSTWQCGLAGAKSSSGVIRSCYLLPGNQFQIVRLFTSEQ